jgi:hypothetical protein
MSDRVSNFTSNQTLPQKVVVPSLTKRAGSKIPVPKVILQLAHKINFRGCKVAPEAPLVLREMSRNKVDPQAVINALSSCEGNQPLTQLDDFQLYRLNKVNAALSQALKDYVELVKTDVSTRPQLEQFLDRLESMRDGSDLLGKELHPLVGQQGGRDSKLYRAFRSELQKNYETALVGLQIAVKDAQDRQAVLDRFMMKGEIDSWTMQKLLQQTYRRLGSDDQNQSMGATFLKFSKVGTLVRDHFLKAVLAFLKNPLDPDAKRISSRRKLTFSIALKKIEYLASNIWAPSRTRSTPCAHCMTLPGAPHLKRASTASRKPSIARYGKPMRMAF